MTRAAVDGRVPAWASTTPVVRARCTASCRASTWTPPASRPRTAPPRGARLRRPGAGAQPHHRARAVGPAPAAGRRADPCDGRSAARALASASPSTGLATAVGRGPAGTPAHLDRSCRPWPLRLGDRRASPGRQRADDHPAGSRPRWPSSLAAAGAQAAATGPATRSVGQPSCRSALEICAATVSSTSSPAPDLPVLRRQHPVQPRRSAPSTSTSTRSRERVGVRARRRRVSTATRSSARPTCCRDAALAALGIQVVRFSHRRLVREPDAVRREVLAVLATRRL